jgi:hypothetical protein
VLWEQEVGGLNPPVPTSFPDLFLVLCGGQEAARYPGLARTVAYKTLARANKTYTATMKSIADPYKQGLVAKRSRPGPFNTAPTSHDLAITAVEARDYNLVAGVSIALASPLDFVQPQLIKRGKQ